MFDINRNEYYVDMLDKMILKRILVYNESILHCTSNHHNTGRKQSYNKRPMGHIAHLRKQFKSLYHNVDLEKKKNNMKLMRIFGSSFEET